MYRQLLLTILFLLITFVSYPGSQKNVPGEVPVYNPLENIYSSLKDSTINHEAFALALTGQKELIARGLVTRPDLLTVIDYSRPSNENRFFVINVETNSVLYKTLVAHGRNSGEIYASRFSNKPQSHQSALGFFITGSPYQGGQGYSLHLNGVDTGFNDNARARAIVIHGAEYVTPKYIERYGRLGRSLGCPALPPHLNSSVINLIKDGSVIFAYYPDINYLNKSSFITRQALVLKSQGPASP